MEIMIILILYLVHGFINNVHGFGSTCSISRTGNFHGIVWPNHIRYTLPSGLCFKKYGFPRECSNIPGRKQIGIELSACAFLVSPTVKVEHNVHQYYEAEISRRWPCMGQVDITILLFCQDYPKRPPGKYRPPTNGWFDPPGTKKPFLPSLFGTPTTKKPFLPPLFGPPGTKRPFPPPGPPGPRPPGPPGIFSTPRPPRPPRTARPRPPGPANPPGPNDQNGLQYNITVNITIGPAGPTGAPPGEDIYQGNTPDEGEDPDPNGNYADIAEDPEPDPEPGPEPGEKPGEEPREEPSPDDITYDITGLHPPRRPPPGDTNGPYVPVDCLGKYAMRVPATSSCPPLSCQSEPWPINVPGPLCHYDYSKPGCECKPGYILNSLDGSCVKPKKCPK